jgi:hypothetical protein
VWNQADFGVPSTPRRSLIVAAPDFAGFSQLTGGICPLAATSRFVFSGKLNVDSRLSRRPGGRSGSTLSGGLRGRGRESLHGGGDGGPAGCKAGGL